MSYAKFSFKVFEEMNNSLLYINCKIIFWYILLFSLPVQADIVKPALIEISVYTDGHYRVEIRASIEAMLTGISSEYKDTSQSPNAKQYDVLREMLPSELEKEFQPFHKKLTEIVKLKLDNKLAPLLITHTEIPEPGYTKVPRISLIVLEGKISRQVQQLSWYYPVSFAENSVRVRQVDEKKQKWHWSDRQWLRENQWSKPFALNEVFHAPTTWTVVKTYTQSGFYHILPKGYDHILFILGIFLLSIKLKPLLWQVTMFTIAHSITLSLAMFEVFTLPANIVEPLIGISIAYIGIENIFTKEIKPSRFIVVFVFGLLHGMGFASMLSDFGMPNNSFVTALISFNIGVELGQLFIILLAFFTIAYWFKHEKWYRNAIVIPASLFISLIGLYWAYVRIG